MNSTPKAAKKNLFQLGFNFLFVILIFLPLSITLFSKNTAENSIENRQLEQLPSISVAATSLRHFVQQFNSYFDDNFGFRYKLIHWRSDILANLFNISPSSKVIIGENKWLYYDGGTGENVIANYYRGLNPFTNAQLAKMAAILTHHQAWLAKQKIAYFLVIAPDKESIYPEFLPSYLTQINHVTRLDQLINYLHEHTTINVIDLRPTLIAHKNMAQLYYKNDTHWNLTGGFYGYQQIIERVKQKFPQIPLLTANDFIKTPSTHDGDLARMIDLESVYTSNETLLQLRAAACNGVTPLPQYNTPNAPSGFDAFATVCNNQHLPKAVIVRDSFTVALISLLQQDFRRAVFLWTYTFPYATIKKEHPDVVIQEIVERNLTTILTDLP